MNPFEFINFKKDDIRYNCTKENSFTEAQFIEFFEIIKAYIEKFKEVRPSKKLTDDIANELIKFSEELIWQGSKYSFITEWLTQAVWVDYSYNWARIRLGKHCNKDIGMEVYDVLNDRISEAELIELLKEELNIKTELESRVKPEINELNSDCPVEQLTKLFDGLNKGKKRIDIKRENDFIKLFHDANLVAWRRIKWTGSNPELATLIFKLTKSKPVPSLVNKYFEPRSNYDSNSYKGRIDNHAIIIIYNRSKV